jgi:large subunit ribosomal protein L9
VKVVLRSDIKGVGRRGDIVEVAGGFARNYLLPNEKAFPANERVEAQAAAMRRGRDLREAKDRQSAEAQAALLAGAVIPIAARAGAGGRLFGSVSASDVVDAVVSNKGVELDRHHVNLAEPIKTVGQHEITVALFEDVAVTFTIDVTAAT